MSTENLNANIRDSYGLFKKVKMHFAADENRQLLQLLSRPNVRYVQTTLKQNHLRYYRVGVNIYSADMFRKRIANGFSMNYVNDYIVLFSVNTKVEPDGIRFLRHGRKTAIPIGAHFQWMEVDGMMYKELPASAVTHMQDFEVSKVDINQSNDTFTLQGMIPTTFPLIESSLDYLTHIKSKIDPIISQLAEIKANVNLFKSDIGQSAVFNAITVLMNNMAILKYDQDSQLVREKLINVLTHNDHIELLPNQLIRLTATATPTATISKSIPLGMFEVNGAYFKDKLEYEFALKRHKTEEDAIAEQKQLNRYEYLMDYCNLDERLNQMSYIEITDTTNFGPGLVMTQNEQEVYFRDESSDLSQKLEMTAFDRWQTVHPEHNDKRFNRFASPKVIDN